MKIQTGIEALDQDLKSLFAFFRKAGANLKKITALAEDENINEEIFFKLVPAPIVRLSIALSNETSFASLLKQCTPQGEELLQEAKEKIKRYLPHIHNHPLIIKRLNREVKEEKTKKALDLNVISKIVPVSTFFEEGGKLIPAVRIGFFDRSDKLLLDSSMDWDDLLFVIKGLLSIMETELGKCEKLTKADLLILEKDQISDKISSMKKILPNILEKLQGVFGIKA